MRKISLVYFADSEKGACYQYRVNNPMQALDQGRFGTQFSEKWKPEFQQAGDIFTFQRNSTKESIQIIYQLHKRNRATVYDMDDDIFQIPESNPVHDLYLHSPHIPWHQVIGMRYATAVTVSCQRLKEVYEPINKNIHVLPNCLDDWKGIYPLLADNGRIRLFWGGSPTHSADLDLIRSVLVDLSKKHGETIEIIIMGSDSEKFACPITYMPFGPYSFFQGVMFSCHIGLAPMSDSLFNLGKSDLRLKELGASHLPIVASKFGEYDKEESGALLCKTKNEWYEAIDKLIVNEQFRKSQAEICHKWAMSWTINQHVHLWEKIYEELLGGSPRRSLSKSVTVQSSKRPPRVSDGDKIRVGKYALGGNTVDSSGPNSRFPIVNP